MGIYQGGEAALIVSGTCLGVFALVYKHYKKNNYEDEEFIPKGTVFPDPDDDIYEEDLDDPPFAPEPAWHHFITKYFEKEKPPIDRAMLRLHICTMSFIHRTKPESIPKGHIPVDQQLLDELKEKYV